MVPTQQELDAHWGYIYSITHLITGCIYVGKHRHRAGESFDFYFGSGVRIGAAVAREGRGAFHKAVVEFVSCEEEARLRERAHIEAMVQSGQEYYNVLLPAPKPAWPVMHADDPKASLWIYLCCCCGAAHLAGVSDSSNKYSLCVDCLAVMKDGQKLYRRLTWAEFTPEAIELARRFNIDPALRRVTRQMLATRNETLAEAHATEESEV